MLGGGEGRNVPNGGRTATKCICHALVAMLVVTPAPGFAGAAHARACAAPPVLAPPVHARVVANGALVGCEPALLAGPHGVCVPIVVAHPAGAGTRRARLDWARQRAAVPGDRPAGAASLPAPRDPALQARQAVLVLAYTGHAALAWERARQSGVPLDADLWHALRHGPYFSDLLTLGGGRLVEPFLDDETWHFVRFFIAERPRADLWRRRIALGLADAPDAFLADPDPLIDLWHGPPGGLGTGVVEFWHDAAADRTLVIAVAAGGLAVDAAIRPGRPWLVTRHAQGDRVHTVDADGCAAAWQPFAAGRPQIHKALSNE